MAPLAFISRPDATWANRGNHNETTAQKFLPDFTFEQLQAAALQAQKNGAFKQPYGDLPALSTPEALNKELADLKPSFFDADFERKSPDLSCTPIACQQPGGRCGR